MYYICSTNKIAMLTIRLSKDAEALALYLSQKRKVKSPYEAGIDLFGQEGSGSNDLSVSYKQKLKDQLNAKHPH